MSDTASVLGHHLEAFGIGLDEIMKDYDGNSVVIAPQGTFKGADAIRGFFTEFIGGLPDGFMEKFTLTKQEVVGEVAYITWTADPFVALGTDTFVVRDGKVAFQTFAAK